MIFYCLKCGCVVGKEIEGKIKKGTKYLCNNCYILVFKKPQPDYPDAIKDLFGEFK